VLRAGSPREPVSLDPAQIWDDTSSFYACNIFDTLVLLDGRTLQLKPWLALRWQTSADGRTWTFDLRRGVRFHDGTPFDAEAVVFSFFRQMDPANPRRKTEFPMFAEIFTGLKEVRKSGPYQVQFVLSEPFFPFLASLTVECAAIVSPAAVRKHGAHFARQPVGTGPFRLDSWQKDKRLVLKANREYWAGRPDIDEYISLFEPRAEMLAKHFQDGLLDIITSYSISKTASYRKQDWIQVIAEPYLSVTFMVLNPTRPALKSRAVRQALCHAWDPRTLTLLFQDFVLPVHTLLPPPLVGGGAPEPRLPFSLARAQALLRQEGGGGEIQLECLLPKDDGLIFQLFSLYAKNLKQAGVKLKLTRLEPDAYAGRIAAGDFDLTFSGWVADYPDPDSMLFPLLSPQLLKQGFANLAVGRHPDLEERLARARRERDGGVRQSLYREIDRIILSEGLALPLYQDKRVLICNRKPSRILPNPLGRLFLFDVKLK
jgi:peptide/nickel transport system substrate-binding protein